MELKLTLACVIVVCSALAGRSIAWAAGRRARILLDLAEGLKLLRVQIVNLLEPLDRALNASGNPLLKAVGAHLTEEGGAYSAWKRVWEEHSRRGSDADSLGEEEYGILDALFMKLGSTGCAAQDVILSGSIEAIVHRHSEARERALRANQLYTSMGALIGLTAAVLMI